MPASCFHCGKTSQYGRSYTHRRGVAGGRWKKRAQKTLRIFKVNLQHVTIIENSRESRLRLCGKCIKRIKYDLSKGNRPFLMLANLRSHTAPAVHPPLDKAYAPA